MADRQRTTAAPATTAPLVRGRPRSARADGAILSATVDLLAEVGLDGTTIQAIADRAGVARATIYLRWPSREALITSALRHAIGREPYVLSGDIETDMRLGGEQGQAIFSEPIFRAVLPALVREFVRAEGPGVSFHALFPNRVRVAEEYDRLAAAQGLRTDIDGEIVADALIGAMLLHYLATTSPPSADYTDRLVDVLMQGLRRDGPPERKR